MPRYDYLCKTGHWFEAIRGYAETYTPCPEHGKPAKRAEFYHTYAKTETAGHSLPGLNDIRDSKGRFRLSTYQEASEEVNDAYLRVEKREGCEIPRPNLYEAGLQRARQMGAKIREKVR